MGKKQFKLLTAVSSNEVSLCSKYNSGANKQTEFEIVKNEESTTDRDIRLVIQNLIKMSDFYSEVSVEPEEKEATDSFKEFLNYWLEYEVDNTYYNLLSEALQSALYDIKYKDMSKEEKIKEYEKVFNMFIEEYKSLPITKNQDGKYEVSLSANSHIKDVVENPQNETKDITKENTSKMNKEEQLNVIQKAFEALKSALGLEKTKTPAEEQPESQPQVEENADETETVEAPAKTEEDKPAEVEPPVVQKVVEQAEENADETPAEEPAETEEKVEKTTDSQIEELVKAKLEVEKELADLKKANEEKAIAIEKMSFIQKAKDEYSMLVGTPEEIGEKLYSISKSSLDEETKTFIMEQLKKVSESNSELTEETGSITKNAGDMTEEDLIYAKAEEIAKSKGISVKQALREVK